MLGLFSNKTDVATTVTAVGNAFDGLFTSDEERAQGQAILAKLKQEPHLIQAMTNKIAAGHKHWFVAGGRPFILWVCGLNLLQMGVGAIWLSVTPPQWYVDMTTTITLGVLGLYGTMRTVEKVKGKTP